MTEKRNSHIDREQIRKWLTEITYSEKLFFSYYQNTGQNYPIEKLFEFAAKSPQKSIGMEANTDFRSISFNYIDLKQTLLFSETDWIHPFTDIALHKHLRYFPTFFHTHAFFEVCYVIDGSCQHTLRAENQNFSLDLCTGDILIIPPGTEHSLLMNSNSMVVNILIRKSTFESALLNNLPSDTPLYDFFLKTLYTRENRRYLLYHTGSDQNLYDLFFHMAEVYCNNQPYSRNIMDSLLSVFFSIILRDHSSSMEFAGKSVPCLELIPAILQYIEVNYAHINIQKIAEHFQFNPSYLGHIFRENTGTTLIDALIMTRISKAKELLETSGLSVDFIAELTGYTDVTHFIRVFKKNTGVTPLQYRKRYLAQENR